MRFLRKYKHADDLLGLLGGLGCIGLSRIDAGWSWFWLIAGVILIAWSAGSFLAARFRR